MKKVPPKYIYKKSRGTKICIKKKQKRKGKWMEKLKGKEERERKDGNMVQKSRYNRRKKACPSFSRPPEVPKNLKPRKKKG